MKRYTSKLDELEIRLSMAIATRDELLQARDEYAMMGGSSPSLSRMDKILVIMDDDIAQIRRAIAEEKL